MSKMFKIKNIITKAESLLNEMNARAAEKWHPEKETVAMYTVVPPMSANNCPFFSVNIFLNGYRYGEKPKYRFTISNEKYAEFEEMHGDARESKRKEITFEKMIEMIEKIKRGELLDDWQSSVSEEEENVEDKQEECEEEKPVCYGNFEEEESADCEECEHEESCVEEGEANKTQKRTKRRNGKKKNDGEVQEDEQNQQG